MRSLCIQPDGSMTIKQIPVPALTNEAQVKIRVECASLSDLDANEARLKSGTASMPGMEVCGTILETGKLAVLQGFRVGERVSALPVIPCGRCDNCRRGHRSNCTSIRPASGMLAEQLILETGQLIRVPEDFTSQQACCIWSVAEGLEAIERSRIEFGATALILGSDYSAQLLCKLLRLHSCRLIAAAGDPENGKKRILRTGANLFVDGSQELIAQRELLKATDFQGFDSVFVTADDVGLEWMFQGFAKYGGTLCLLAFKRINYGISIGQSGILSRNLTLVSSYLSDNKIQTAMDIIPELHPEELFDSEIDPEDASLYWSKVCSGECAKVFIRFH